MFGRNNRISGLYASEHRPRKKKQGNDKLNRNGVGELLSFGIFKFGLLVYFSAYQSFPLFYY